MKPTTYKHWRKLYQQTLRAIGLAVSFRAKDRRVIAIDRNIYHLLRRLARLRLRLDVEY